MPTQTLQNKITGEPGQYVKINSDGEAEAFSVVSGVMPTIIIAAPINSVVICRQGDTVLTSSEKTISSTHSQYTFTPIDYGIWSIEATNNGSYYIDYVDVDEVITYEVEIEEYVSTTLNDNSWATIQKVAAANAGDSYWAVGDTKSVTLTNTSSVTTYEISGSDGVDFQDGTYNATIIGFNHNSNLEGSGLIHFQLYQNNTLYGSWKGFKFISPEEYGTDGSLVTKENLIGGWKDSYIRTSLGKRIEDSNTILDCFSNDLKAALAPVIKYEDNTPTIDDSINGISSFSRISYTIDYVFLPSFIELCVESGVVDSNHVYSNINSAEKEFQETYAFYNQDIKSILIRNTPGYRWMTRTIIPSGYIVGITVSGTPSYTGDSYSVPKSSYYISPCFCVGINSLLS